jgi:2-polyprenyl-3-methyl-5-hydroxy-6-metoxy-1,4-benzoquinol methylase
VLKTDTSGVLTHNSDKAMLPLVGPGTLADYPWQDLKGKTIVDIGGGRGTMSVALAKQ